MYDYSFSESNVKLINGAYQVICIFVEDKTGVTVLLYCYHKSGLVPSTPSSQFRDNSLWDSRLLLSIVVRAFPHFVLTSNESYALNCVSCFLLD